MVIILQLFEGIFAGTVIIAGLAVCFWVWRHVDERKMRKVEHEQEQSKVRFRDALTQGVKTGVNNRANVRVIGEAVSIEHWSHAPVPHSLTYSPHMPSHGTVSEEQPTQALLPAATVQQPDLRTIVEELPHNKLAFAFGADRLTGEMVKSTLLKAVHIQSIGATGQGKSHQSTSILTQLCATNDTQHLNLALIDCEGQTTEPFQQQPHVRHHADDPEQAARVLRSLVKLLEHRDKTQQDMPVMLVFVEEFLNLRRSMPAHIKDQALEDYTTLALRGKKRGMFLFSVGQTAYVEKAIRHAQNQFQSSMAFAGKPNMARAAGFTNTDLLNQLWKERQPGQFLLERPTGDSLLLAPFVNSSQVPSLVSSQVVPSHFPGGSQVVPDDTNHNNMNPAGPQSAIDKTKLTLMREMIVQESSQNEIIAAVFPGMRASDAQKEYRKYMAAMARQLA